MIPPVSPYGLIQETLWPDKWKILVACMLLNCTTRKAVERIVPVLFRRFPDPSSMAAADFDVLSNIIAPLGFRNRRARKLIEMSKRYKEADWKSVEELPGIGPYAAAAWHIFVKGDVPSVCPEDHALTLWWHWYQKRKGDAT